MNIQSIVGLDSLAGTFVADIAVGYIVAADNFAVGTVVVGHIVVPDNFVGQIVVAWYIAVVRIAEVDNFAADIAVVGIVDNSD